MDIDEFLDKEIQAEKREEDKLIANQGNLNIQEPAKPQTARLEPAKMEEGINSDINLLEKQYFELWEKISRENLLWNNELYKGINSAADDIKEKASKFLLRLSSDKKIAKELIEKAKKELENNDHESALGLYSRIIAIKESIPDTFFEEKVELNEQLFHLYQELHKQIDSKFIKNLMITIGKIDSLADKSFENIKKGSLTEAEKFYSESIELFKGIPHGFLLQKIDAGIKLLALYKELSIHKQIRNLQEQLMLDKSKKHFQGTEFRSYKLRRLAEIVNQNKEDQENLDFNKKYPLTNLPRGKTKYGKDILRKLVERKMQRARISLEKGFYADAKKNIESVLRLDPSNMNAKRMLIKIPK